MILVDGTLNPSICVMVALARFESLPLRIHNVSSIYLLDGYRYTSAGQKTTIDILRTNHNINREALAILYRDVPLVSIEWNQSERTYLDLFRMPQDRPFCFLSSPTSMWHYKYIIAFCTEEGSRKPWCSPELVSFVRKIPLSLVRQKSPIHTVRSMMITNTQDLQKRFRRKLSLLLTALLDLLLDRLSFTIYPQDGLFASSSVVGKMSVAPIRLLGRHSSGKSSRGAR